MSVHRLITTDLRNSKAYFHIYMVWMYMIFMYIIPFTVLLILNFQIALTIRR